MGLQRKYLDNGVQVIYQSIPGIVRNYIALVFRVGSRDELPGQRGLAHMFEHMLFKGSARYPDLLALACEVEPYSEEFNAETSDYATIVSAECTRQGFEKVFAVLTDMVINPLFRPKDFLKERQTVINEIRDAFDDPDSYCLAEFYKIALVGTPIAFPTLGYEDTLSELTTRDMRNFHRQHFHAGNLALIVTGDFSPKTLMGLANRYLGGMDTREPTARMYEVSPNYMPKTLNIRRELSQAHVFFGAPIGAELTPEQMARWQMFIRMAGEGFSSPVYHELTCGRGSVYSVDCDVAYDPDMSSIKIAFSCNPDDVERNLKLIKKELAEVLYNRKRFNATRRNWLSVLAMDKDDANVVFEAATDLWPKTGNIYSQRTLKQLILSTSLAAIQKQIEPYLDFENWTTVIVGPNAP